MRLATFLVTKKPLSESAILCQLSHRASHENASYSASPKPVSSPRSYLQSMINTIVRSMLQMHINDKTTPAANSIAKEVGEWNSSVQNLISGGLSWGSGELSIEA